MGMDGLVVRRQRYGFFTEHALRLIKNVYLCADKSIRDYEQKTPIIDCGRGYRYDGFGSNQFQQGHHAVCDA